MPDWPEDGSCGPPGGGGRAYAVPYYEGSSFPSQHGIFYSWDHRTDPIYRTLRVNADGTVDIHIEYPNGMGECYKPSMKVAKTGLEKDLYLVAREMRFDMLRPYVRDFEKEWGDRPKPKGGIFEDTYYLPMLEGHDCPMQILDPLAGRIRITYKSGNGWSVLSSVYAFKSKAEVSTFRALRSDYCSLLARYMADGEAAWKKYAGEY